MGGFADEVIKKLAENKIESIEVPGESEPKAYSPNPGGKSPKTFDKEKCNECMSCVKLCPTEAIDCKSLEIDVMLCINCMRCCRICPNDARAFDSTEIKKYLEGNYLGRREIEVFI